MKLCKPQKPRRLLGGFSSVVGNGALKIRIYRDQDSFVFEREIVERDGTSLTLVLPFVEPEVMRKLFVADPNYIYMKGQAGRVLVKLNQAMREINEQGFS